MMQKVETNLEDLLKIVDNLEEAVLQIHIELKAMKRRIRTLEITKSGVLSTNVTTSTASGIYANHYTGC